MAKKKKEYSFSRFVKDFDLFGYPVQLNFDEKGSTHQTCCGGLASFFFVAIVFTVVVAQLVVAGSKSQSMFFTHEYPYDATKMDSSIMKDATLGLGSFLYVLDTTGETPVPISASTVGNYLSISYVDESGSSTNAVTCGEEYFSDTVTPYEKSDSVYEQLSAYQGAMICPDASDVSPLNMNLQVRCKNCGDELNGMSIVTMMFASKANMANTEYPLFSYYYSTGSFNLDKRNKYFHTVPLRFNQMALHDKPFGFGGPSEGSSMSFFDNQYADQGPISMGTNNYGSPVTGQSPSNLLLSQSFKISPLALMHHKRIYTFWIWLALVGGIIYSLVQSFTWCIRPIARHGFVMRAMKRLFLIRTKDETLFKVQSNDQLRYQRDFDEIHEDPNWPIVTDPFGEDFCEEQEICDSVNDQNFGVQPQGQQQYQNDDCYEGGSKQSKHSPRFENGQNSSRNNSRGARNPRSKKTYMEDTNTHDHSQSGKNSKQPLKKSQNAQKVQNVKNGKNDKNEKKPAPKAKKGGRKVSMAENPVLEKCSTAVQEEVAIHRVPRIYNTRWFTMCCGNIIRALICCSAKTCDCCCDCCFSNLKRYIVYDEAVRRLDEEMDIVKILKKMRNMQVMMNSTHVNTETRRFKLAHTFHNIIDVVESDDECCKHKEQDRKMKVQALDGEEIPSGAEDNHRDHNNEPFTPTMGQGEAEDEIPTFEQELDKNIDHQVLFHGYPVGIPCCPPAQKQALPPQPVYPQPVYYKEMSQEKPVVHAHASKKMNNSFQDLEQQHHMPQQDRFVRKQQNAHASPQYQRNSKPRGSAGEQYSYDSQDYDDECYSSDRQRYYNDRNGSNVKDHEQKSDKDHIPVHDFRQDQTHKKKPDPQNDLYQEQRKMTLPKYKQGKKFDQSQKNPNAVLNKYNRFEVEER